MDSVRKVYTLTEAIAEFILDSKYLKSVLVLQIFNTVTKIQNIITPLLPGHHITPYLLQCLVDTEAVLLSTWENLSLWNDGRSKPLRALITGRSVAGKLKVDRDHLITRQATLLGAVQIVSQVKGYNVITSTSVSRFRAENKSMLSLKMKMKMSDDDRSSVFEADHFWRCYIGVESPIIESEEFCKVLSLWLGHQLSDIACQRLLLRLDETNTGCVTSSTFQGFVRQGNLRETVNLYTSDPQLPLLVWVDNDISAIIPKVVEASQQGLTVFQFTSTAATKAWVRINEEFLKKNEDSGRIRFVINQVLYERDDYYILSTNDKAGYQVTSFIRLRDIRVPILVYTSKSNLHLTKYVEDFEMIGSLCGNDLIFQAYVAALASGRKDDTRWMRYNA